MRLLVFAASVAVLALPLAATAHPGGLNAEGCHNDRKNGGYHCHRGSGGGTSRSTPPNQARGLVGSGSSSGGAFRSCAEARAAGKAPVRRGQPGYGPHLDRDGDGVGCERG